MAPPTSLKMMPLALLLYQCLIVPSALAAIICEDLPQDHCAFAISASSKRCVLESYRHNGGPTEYQCQTSEIVVELMSNHIETGYCIKACGVDRNSIGISSDAFLEPRFTEKLCSSECYHNCPNIVDLYYNLAASEGVLLPDLCQARQSNPHRAMTELVSSGAAPGPVAGGEVSKLEASPVPTPALAPMPSESIFSSLCEDCL